MLGTASAIALTLTVVIVAIYEFNFQRKENKKEAKPGKHEIAILRLMDNMREFLKAGTSVDDVFTMMPTNLRTSERAIHDKCKSKYPNDPCYCLVCCIEREVVTEKIAVLTYAGRTQ